MHIASLIESLGMGSIWPIFLTPVSPPVRYLSIGKVPCSFFFHRLNNHSSASAYMVLNPLCDLFLALLPAGPCLPCTGEPRAEHSNPEVSHQG